MCFLFRTDLTNSCLFEILVKITHTLIYKPNQWPHQCKVGTCFVRDGTLLGRGLGLVVNVLYKLWGNQERERSTPDTLKDGRYWNHKICLTKAKGRDKVEN